MPAYPPLLVEHTAVFLWALSLAGLPSRHSPVLLGTQLTASGSAVCVHRQPLPSCLQVGVGQVVFLQSKHLPVSSPVPGTVSLIFR